MNLMKFWIYVCIYVLIYLLIGGEVWRFDFEGYRILDGVV